MPTDEYIHGNDLSTPEKIAGSAADALDEKIVLLEKRVNNIFLSVNSIEQFSSEIDARKNEVNDFLSSLKKEKSAFASLLKAIASISSSAKEKEGQIQDNLIKSNNLVHVIDGQHDQVAGKLKEIDALQSELSALDEIKKSLEECKVTANEDAKKINDIYNNVQSQLAFAQKKNSFIDVVYKEIIGHDTKNEDGEDVHVDGLKDELKKSFDDLMEGFQNLSKDFKDLKISSNKDFSSFISASREEYKNTLRQLEDLLPGALATGLSHAYDKKKREEVVEQKRNAAVFIKCVIGLICISFIPIAVDFFLVVGKGIDILKVVEDTPKMIVLMMPIYVPILWLAHSANKKINLSKRLIEEYTHKSVLGKTFSGLSKQISDLSQSDSVKNELREKLLFNLLHVSSENPGKLITDYQKSDHPLMEALENSAKLAASVERLAKIPGFSSMAKKLSEKSEKLLEEKRKQVDTGLDAQDELQKEKN
ncbi:hypothetical protein KIK84_01600 [Curvibacter sp. CHRR-16]|uniref:hypothetical protein n=1 Tax=Curvibacter sp. CHRR-16 TaxID=2835872 RepID=UPI001BDA7B9C|nr:hypothetical protein [Curvibacter sp. CHRR-16]MBT0569010.1 hypothetical protein [Curvibacter sp. CHRR-16]